MKFRFIILILIFSTKLVFCQDSSSVYHTLVRIADSLYWAKDYHNSALKYSEAFKTKGWRAYSDDRYKAASSWTLAKIPDSAFYQLERLIIYARFTDSNRLLKDPDFNSLHTDKRWKQMLDRMKQNILPEGCIRGGNKRGSYLMYIADSAGQEGKDVFTIKSFEKEIDGFGTLMQNSLPKEFLGKKICMTGYMKSENVKGWAGFWLRIDQPNKNAPKQFDNMQNRPIKGTTDWKKYEIVLKVPSEATNIAFGGLLHGTGQIWFEKIEFKIVGKLVPTTGSIGN